MVELVIPATEGLLLPRSKILSSWHGDDNFRMLVFEHFRPEMNVLEAACAQGNLTLAMAPHVRSVLAYDANPDNIDMTREAAGESEITNAKFLVFNSWVHFNDV
ncbi:MAG: hypothetical protein WCK35_28600 [Chloroflexota bacterium]